MTLIQKVIYWTIRAADWPHLPFFNFPAVLGLALTQKSRARQSFFLNDKVIQ